MTQRHYGFLMDYTYLSTYHRMIALFTGEVYSLRSQCSPVSLFGSPRAWKSEHPNDINTRKSVGH